MTRPTDASIVRAWEQYCREHAGDKDGKLMQDELVARIAGLRVDAERYRHAVNYMAPAIFTRGAGFGLSMGRRCDKTEVDAAIDAARFEKPPA